MAASWTIDTVKEHFERLLEEKDKALSAALIAVKEENRKTEIAAEKRFELLNELRSGVATKDEVRALEKIVEDLKGKSDKGEGRSAGINWIMGLLIAAAAAAGAILGKFI